MGMNVNVVDRLMDTQEGILKLKPNYVRRVYKDGGRLAGGAPGATWLPDVKLYRPERWIASCTEATNPYPIPGEGLSRLADSRMTLKEAFEAAGERLLGPRRYRAHGPEFRVLLKVLDGYTPVPFHFHASDEAVQRDRVHFARHRFGKDEAYYILEGPKGPCPYTHVGLYPGTRLRDVRRALERGGDAVLELSPYFLQRWGEGFFVPGGVVHRPGTAFTLEIQQPSDISIRLQGRIDGRKLTPEEQHAGFDTLDEALKHLDLALSTQRDILDRYRIVPRRVSRKPLRGADEDWIFPPRLCRKFSGKRLRVRSRVTTVERECYALLVWKGAGRVGPHRVRAGDEFFVSYEAARAGVAIERERGDVLEVFKCFAAPVTG